MKRFYKLMGLAASLCFAASCGDKNSENSPIAQACGFVCPGGTLNGSVLEGIEQGNASISGVTEVDAFFSATLNFSSAANGVSNGIQAQLDAIKADFGINGELAAGLKAQFTANLEGSLDIDYQPAQCVVDAQASVEAAAQCDATIDPGKISVECKGACEAEVTADVKCDASADLRCTVTAPAVKCEGSCSGSCEVDVDASGECGGSCKGSCSGECSGYVKNATTGQLECAGKCSGKCTGKCDIELMAEAECKGSCTGECTVTKPSGGCEGGIRAECKAKADASFTCNGRCTGEFEPPMVKAECQATAKAQASVNVECTPPHLAVNYKLKAAANADFQAALKSLVSVRLPALLQATSKGNLVAQAGEGLGVAANGAVKAAVNASKNDKLTFKLANGLRCAGNELPKALTIVDNAADGLTAKLGDAHDLAKAVGLET
jgi:hypothetical protein